MIENGKEILALQSMEDRYKLNMKKIILIFTCIAVFIGLIFTIIYCSKSIKEYKINKKYQEQLALLELKEKAIQEELERKRQEKIPKLTEMRKRKYRNYISFRDQKSIFNI